MTETWCNRVASADVAVGAALAQQLPRLVLLDLLPQAKGCGECAARQQEGPLNDCGCDKAAHALHDSSGDIGSDEPSACGAKRIEHADANAHMPCVQGLCGRK